METTQKATTFALRPTAAQIALVMPLASIGFLAALHILSPEFDPATRMVSEYALGKHAWAIALMFATWSFGSLALAVAGFSISRSIIARLGVLLLAVAGIGQMLGAIFGQPTDPNHGLAFALGVPSLPIAALLLSWKWGRETRLAPFRSRLRLTAQLPWISLALMIAVIFIGLASSGGQWGPQILVGWPNRLLVVAYNGWVGLTAWALLQTQPE